MKNVIVQKQEHRLNVVLNKSEQHNAFEPEMIGDLTEIFRSIEKDKEVRVVVLRGEGKSFCAGADLAWMKSMAAYDFESNCEDARLLHKMFDVMNSCKVPIIGKVHGHVMGGGLGLLAVCDIVAAHRDAKFCFSEARLGLIPSVISPFVMKRASSSLARQLMITAEVFDTARAQNLGLVHFSGESEEVDDFVQSQIDFILSNGPEALRVLKGLLKFQETHGPDEIAQETIRVIAERRVSHEGQEGLAAFFEKRKPSWKLD